METIGQRMTYLMKQKGISNVEIAELLDIDPSYVSKFKTDQRRPNTFQIDKIAQKLNTTTDFLLGNNVSGVPFFTNFEKNESQDMNLMNGLYGNKHFALFSQWNTIQGINKDDMLIFQRVNNDEKNSYNNNIVITYIYNNTNNSKQLALGRYLNNVLYFDNGLPPILLKENDEVVGKLIRLMRYFN